MSRSKHSPIEASSHPVAIWLATHRVTPKPEVDESASSRNRRVHGLSVECRIDLHGYTRAEAIAGLEDFLARRSAEGVEKALIIHGKGLHRGGESVLREVVREILKYSPHVRRSGPASFKQGGDGATWVVLR